MQTMCGSTSDPSVSHLPFDFQQICNLIHSLNPFFRSNPFLKYLHRFSGLNFTGSQHQVSRLKNGMFACKITFYGYDDVFYGQSYIFAESLSHGQINHIFYYLQFCRINQHFPLMGDCMLLGFILFIITKNFKHP